MHWKQYEKEICECLKFQYPEAEITLDARRIGRYSKTERQIDILIEQYVAGNKINTVVDGKYWHKKLDVKAVDDFIGMLEDIDAQKGLIISLKGYSEAAYNRAHFGSSDIELDILNFEELKRFQAYGAIPYAGDNGALLPAPFGWIIDGQNNPLGLATIYLQGKTLKEAMTDHEFMYVQFWDRNKEGHNLEDLLTLQEKNFAHLDPDCFIEYLDPIPRKDAKTALRVAKLKGYPTAEYTGFIEFNDFIFFCVLFTPKNRTKVNVRKLENILKATFPIHVQRK